MSDFDPDAYLASKKSEKKDFDPDEYLAKTKPKTFFEQVKAAFPRTIKSQSVKPTDFESAVSGGINKAVAPVVDVAAGVGKAVSKVPGVSTAFKLLGGLQKGSDWVNKNVFALGQRDYPLQGTAEAINRGIAQTPVLRQIEGLPEATKIAAQSVTDPLNLATMGSGALAKGAAKAATKLSQIPERMTLGTGSFLTGISKPALEEASTKLGRAGLKQTVEAAPQAGTNLASALKNYENSVLENEQVGKILENAPPIDMRSTLQAMESIIPKRLGPMEASTPYLEGLIKGTTERSNLMKGKLPTEKQLAEMDFEGNAQRSRNAMRDPKSEYNMLSDIEKRAKLEEYKAQRRAEKTKEKALKTAGQAGAAKRNLTLNAQNVSPKAPWTGGLNPDVKILENAKIKAKQAAAEAREALINATSKEGSAKFSSTQAQKARVKSEIADRNMHEADAANAFSQGKTPDEVSEYLVREHGLSGDALQTVLERGADKVGKNSFHANYNMPAKDYKQLREWVDKEIDWNSDIGRGIAQALKGPRLHMKERLIEAAGPEYRDIMEKWSEKLDLRDEMQDFLGKQSGTQQNLKAGSFIEQAAKEGNLGPRRELLKKFDKAGGTNFLNEADNLNLAQEFGKDGAPTWLPKGGARRLLSSSFPATAAAASVVAGSPLLAGLGLASSIPLSAVASPKILTGVTLPAARYTGKGIKLSGKLAELPLNLASKNKAKTLAAIQAAKAKEEE